MVTAGSDCHCQTPEHSTSPLAIMVLGLPCACPAVCSQGGAGLRAGPGRPAAAQPAAGGRPAAEVTCCLEQAHRHRVVRQDRIAMASVAGREEVLLPKLGPCHLAFLQTALET